MPSSIGDLVATPSFSGLASIARRDISPPVGIRNRNWGLATQDTSQGLHRPMTLTILALSNGDEPPLVLMALDASWWGSDEDEEHFRSAVLRSLDVDSSQLIVSLSHTHAGPALGLNQSKLDGGHLIAGYLKKLEKAAVSATKEALEELEPATLQWTTGRSSLASDREVEVEGTMVVGFNPEKPADDTVVVGFISNEAGRPLGTLVNYACHPTTLAWQNQEISPDYIGAMREVVEANTGAPCLFVQGASGNLAPRHQYVGDTAVADRHGQSLGYSVLAAITALPPPGTNLVLTGTRESGAPLAIWEPQPAPVNRSLRSVELAVTLDPQKKPSLDELRERWAGIDPQSLEERLRRAKGTIDGFDDTSPVEHPVWAWQIGDGMLVAHPGEAFSAFQMNLRESHPDTPIVVINLANGPGSQYLAPKSVYDAKGYASWASKVAAGSLERLEDHANSLINQLSQES